MNKIEPEARTWNQLTAVRQEGGVGDLLKEDEGINQKHI